MRTYPAQNYHRDEDEHSSPTVKAIAKQDRPMALYVIDEFRYVRADGRRCHLIGPPDSLTSWLPLCLPHAAYPYSSYPYSAYPYILNADDTLKATEFPYIYQKDEQEPAVEEARRRRRRDVKIPLPYLHAVPTVTKHTVETKQFEPIDANTPADTTKIELTTKEHEISVPAVKYVQPVVNVKPVTYTALSHAVLPYAHGLPYVHALPYAHYPGFVGAPVIKLDEE
ncbi:uncharacterized protein LOC119570679 [Penaeus monodon]|uniref:uncharacterized protein LOC119570679 n=1 Tax=Penaeus monodon TaxID=6687 RepID=UPI0018A76DCA|nr:uncharacterized protein LOC119570679 [Penaeus monodon]